MSPAPRREWPQSPDWPGSDRPRWWQHPGVVLLGAITAIGLFTAVAVRVTESPEDNRDQTTEPLPSPLERPTPRALPTPVPVPPSVFQTPTQLEGRDRGALEAALRRMTEAAIAEDHLAVTASTWSGCAATGRAQTDAVRARLFGDPAADRTAVAGWRILDVVIVNDDLASAAVVLPAVEEVSEDDRLVFVWEGEWRSGICADGGEDLDGRISFPDNLLEVAGLDFTDEELDEQQFFQADLRGADFSGASLVESVFTGAQLEGASFSGSDVARSFFGRAVAGPGGADFTNAMLDGSFFFEAELGNSSFVDASARDVDFGSSSLSGVSFAGADLTGSFFDGVDVVAIADWTGATCPDGVMADDVGSSCLSHLDPFG